MDLPLRERKRLAAMDRIQAVAYDLLEEKGFEATTVTEIAARADASPSSVYRYFRTKEGVFLFDPFAEPFRESLTLMLPRLGPIAAVEAAFVEAIAGLGGTTEEVLRTRTRVLLGVPELRESMRAGLLRFGDELSELFVANGSTEIEARVAAVSTVEVMLVGIELWSRPGSTVPLAEATRDTFAALKTVLADI